MPERILVPFHGADHCPGAPDPIPCLGVQFFRAWYSDSTGFTGVDATATPIDFMWWQNGAPSIFEPRKTTGAANPVQGTDLIREVRLKMPGRYTFAVGVKVEDAFNGFSIRMHHDPDDPAFGYSTDLFGGPGGGYNTEGWFSGVISRIYPHVDPFQSDVDEEVSYWPDFTAGGFADVFFAMAADLASGSTEVKHAFLDIGYEPVTFPTDTAWLV